MATFRVWYKNGSARLVTADNATEAREVGRELAELDAADLNAAYRDTKGKDPDRAREIAKEWQGCVVVTEVESLT